jgi:hypothetical protein
MRTPMSVPSIDRNTVMDKSKCFSSLIASTPSSEGVEGKLSMCQYLVLSPLQAATALQ